MTEIYDGVFLGNKNVASSFAFLRSKNIRYVLNVTHEVPNFFENTDVESLQYDAAEAAAIELEFNQIPASKKQKADVAKGVDFDYDTEDDNVDVVEEQQQIATEKPEESISFKDNNNNNTDESTSKMIQEGGNDDSACKTSAVAMQVESELSLSTRSSSPCVPPNEGEQTEVALSEASPIKPEHPTCDATNGDTSEANINNNNDNDDDNNNNKYEKIKYLRLEASDGIEQNMAPFFEKAFQFIDEAKEQNAGVLVHCKEGKSRSVTIIIGYGMARLGWELKRAYEHVLEKRNGEISPNDGFKRQLMALEIVLNSENEAFTGNSLNFFPKRKRVENYNDLESMYDVVEEEEDDEEEEEDEDDYEHQEKRRSKKKQKKARGKGTQMTLFQLVQSMKNDFPVAPRKSTAQQATLAAFFPSLAAAGKIPTTVASTTPVTPSSKKSAVSSTPSNKNNNNNNNKKKRPAPPSSAANKENKPPSKKGGGAGGSSQLTLTSMFQKKKKQDATATATAAAAASMSQPVAKQASILDFFNVGKKAPVSASASASAAETAAAATTPSSDPLATTQEEEEEEAAATAAIGSSTAAAAQVVANF